MGHPVTALGVCTSIGVGLASFWPARLAGAQGFASVAGRGLPTAESCARVEALTLLATDQLDSAVAAARRRWGAARVGLVLGTRFRGGGPTGGGWPGAWVAAVKARLGIGGPALAVVDDSVGGLRAWGIGSAWLRATWLDAVVVGSADCASVPGEVRVASASCRPFGSVRSGTNLSEAAAVALIERQGEAEVEFIALADAIPRGDGPTEEAIVRVIRSVLEQAGVLVGHIGAVFAGSCGLARLDAVEAAALHRVFGGAVPVIAGAGAVGHAMAASGSVSAVTAALAVRDGRLPPSVGSYPLDVSIALDVVPVARDADVEYAIVHALGFDGRSAAAVLRARSR